MKHALDTKWKNALDPLSSQESVATQPTANTRKSARGAGEREASRQGRRLFSGTPFAMRRGRAARPISRRIPALHAMKPASVHTMKPLPSAPLRRYCAQIDPFLSFTAAFDTLCRSTEPSGFLKRLMMFQTLWAIVPGVGSVTLFRVTLTPRSLARISSPLSILSIIRRTSSGWESPPQRVRISASHPSNRSPSSSSPWMVSLMGSLAIRVLEPPRGSRGDATGPGGV